MNGQPPTPPLFPTEPPAGTGVPTNRGADPPPMLHFERLPSPPVRSDGPRRDGRTPIPVPWIAGILSGLILLGGGIVLGIGIGSSGNAGQTELAGGVASRPETTGDAATGTETPVGTTTAGTTTNTTPTTSPATPAATPTKPKPTPKPTYRTLSDRQWKLLAKDPDSYIGKTYVVYGVVTQFDAATGDDTFRADVGPRNMAESWDYETNTLLTGAPRQLRNVVDDDEFRANVTVLGSFSYDTQVGGNTTVPLLRIDTIRLL